MINMVKMAVLPKLHGTPCNPRKNFSINIDIKKLIVKFIWRGNKPTVWPAQY